MSFIKALFLGIIQGASEFFPVSSSAHLKLFKIIFHMKEFQTDYIFDLTCHLGTLLAAIIYLRKDIFELFTKQRQKLLFIILAIVPLIPIYFFFSSSIKYLSKDSFLPFFLLLTSFLIFIASKVKIKNKIQDRRRKIKDVLLIGIMQALALVPGISRSGFTISSGYLRGWKVEDSIKFSFLLAIPTILGGSFLEGIKHFKIEQIITSSNILQYLIAFLASFGVGFIAIRYVFSIKSFNKLKPFAWYLLIVALFSFVYLNFFMK
ncbi:MAG: undecaprenyl-diphosphate phosphatase [Parachlamydiales bacterium]|nr:undecaprenyl-diphosphate phosphatase [Parachlamydiales bacterium]